jgi:undecaprenyl-diphosphatase
MEFLVAFDKGVFFSFDNVVVPAAGPRASDVVVFITSFGDVWTLRGALLVGVAGFATGGRFRSALLLLAVFLLAHALETGTKQFVGRVRPSPTNPVVAVPKSHSFPSGHALESAATYGTLALLAGRSRKKGARRTLITGAVLLVGLIGFSRVYLSVHYVSDVIGGWAAGWALALTCTWVDQRFSPTPLAESRGR